MVDEVVTEMIVAPAMMMSETRSDLAARTATVMGTSAAQVTRDLLGPWCRQLILVAIGLTYS